MSPSASGQAILIDIGGGDDQVLDGRVTEPAWWDIVAAARPDRARAQDPASTIRRISQFLAASRRKGP